VSPLLASAAEPPPKAQAEINGLLDAVGHSACEFYRNGTWYDASRAQEHLRYKYQQLVARNLVGSAEEFIDRAATKSSMSGKGYLIRCPGHDAVPSADWLKQELARERVRSRPKA
jgi:hypothetical protein